MKNLHRSMKQYAVNRRNFRRCIFRSGDDWSVTIADARRAPQFSTDPFTLGAASGDRCPIGVVWHGRGWRAIPLKWRRDASQPIRN